ncbi:NADP-dependent oxidoreductase domain-containing protein [Lipomyces orientalis]|uniref:NADP-dependent oxidoreductase domain-containing protein n=1 Tax=Lipomyces orientalis TaxID=1233043 RepID=A0ACC3TRZ3_9ASCO
MSTQLKVIFGAAGFAMFPVETRNEILSVLENYNVKDIDTAYIYNGSEAALAEVGAPARFTIDTKAPALVPKSLSKSSVLAGAKKSLDTLGVQQVDTYFLHAPDYDTPLEETLSAIQELYEAGTFVHFGLSNFTPTQVQEIYDLATAKGYVLPTVFQGNYNAVARSYEADLFPLLRKLGIKFYAYSPIAGGFLVKSAEAIKAGIKGGRWDPESRFGQLYNKLYNKPKMVAALEDWESIAAVAGVSKAALAYRWLIFNSILDPAYGDAAIIGATTLEQLQETLTVIKDGPLPSAIAAKIDKIWDEIKDEAPVDNVHG